MPFDTGGASVHLWQVPRKSVPSPATGGELMARWFATDGVPGAAAMLSLFRFFWREAEMFSQPATPFRQSFRVHMQHQVAFYEVGPKAFPGGNGDLPPRNKKAKGPRVATPPTAFDILTEISVAPSGPSRPPRTSVNCIPGPRNGGFYGSRSERSETHHLESRRRATNVELCDSLAGRRQPYEGWHDPEVTKLHGGRCR